MGTTLERTHTFDAFARLPFYIEVNRNLVDLASITPGSVVVDLGSGTGAITGILARKIAGARILGVDPDLDAIEIAKRALKGIRGVPITFIQAEAEDFAAKIDQVVDALFFCNAFHLIHKKEQVLAEIHCTLREGGIFSFNTSFYDGGEPPESMRFYRRALGKALRYLRDEHGLSPERGKVEARKRQDPQGYERLLVDSGFRIRKMEIETVQLPFEAFLAICEYWLWIEGVLPGIDLDIGQEALQHGVREAFEHLHLEWSPRNWLQVVAEKV